MRYVFCRMRKYGLLRLSAQSHWPAVNCGDPLNDFITPKRGHTGNIDTAHELGYPPGFHPESAFM